MRIENINQLVIKCLNNLLKDLDNEDPSKEYEPVQVDISTKLIGKDSVLESIGLVSLIADMEDVVEEEYNIAISIADERAMSREKSPFLTVAALSEYILELIQENS